MERRLGRGLGALLPDSGRGKGSLDLELDAIRPNPYQPRENFSPAGLEELRQSIANHGVLQPVVVRRSDVGYELVSGERRWRAARLAGLRTIPAIVRTVVTEAEMLELALVENVQREDLDPMERARGFRQMMNLLSLTQEQVAARVGLKRSSVANLLRLLDLPDSIQQSVSSGDLSMGHARALLALEDPESRLELATAIIRDDLSVREVEHRARKLSGVNASENVPEPSVPEATEAPAAWISGVERRLRDRLGTKATVRNGEGFRGQIVLDYFGREDLERILDLLAPKPLL